MHSSIGKKNRDPDVIVWRAARNLDNWWRTTMFGPTGKGDGTTDADDARQGGIGESGGVA